MIIIVSCVHDPEAKKKKCMMMCCDLNKHFRYYFTIQMESLLRTEQFRRGRKSMKLFKGKPEQQLKSFT